MLDLDATDDPLHGHQEGRFFHGYYDCYCYLPLYVFCGRHLLAAKLRRANIDGQRRGGRGGRAHRRARSARAGPDVRILLRADSGFAREELMAWCEHNARRLPVRPGPQQPAGGRDRGRTGGGQAESRARPASRRAASRTSCGRHATAGAAGAGSSPRPNGRKARPIRASSSPRSSRERDRGPPPLREALLRPRRDGEPHQGMPAATCSPTAPRPPPCAPTSCACGSPPWPMC